MAMDYRNEDVIKHAKQAFTETVLLKVNQLYQYVEKGVNPDLTGAYIEELVREFIQRWIGTRLLLQGTFYSQQSKRSCEAPMQIDGIIYDPTKGPSVLRQGNFIVVHPVFCAGVIEIKTSISGSLNTLENRLKQIHGRYMHHSRKANVMAVVILDPDPESTSTIQSGPVSKAWEFSNVGWCPIFVLFKRRDDTGEHEPFEQGIDAMIRAN